MPRSLTSTLKVCSWQRFTSQGGSLQTWEGLKVKHRMYILKRHCLNTLFLHPIKVTARLNPPHPRQEPHGF